MNYLTLYYDPRCGLCQRLAQFLTTRRQLVPLHCRPQPPGNGDDLIVTADTGETWRGSAAWLIVLWALDETRDWSYRLASPALLPLARQAFATLSAHRSRLSRWLHWDASDDALAAEFRNAEVPPCHVKN